MAKLRNNARKFLAVIVDDRGQKYMKYFATRQSAMNWLEKLAADSIEGKAERIEIYNRRKALVWSKVRS